MLFLGTIKNLGPQSQTRQSPRKYRGWRLAAWITLIAFVVLLVVGEIVLKRAGPILKGRVIETLSTRFDSHVELDDLQVSLIKGLAVSGKGLRIFAPDDVVAAGAKDPIIAVRQFEFHASLIGLFLKPTHVGTANVQGLQIKIPPKSVRQNGQKSRHQGKIKILVDRIVFDDSQLVIDTDKPDKDPKVFALKHIVLRNVSQDSPSPYDATLTNAIPTGDIHAVGTFGPWNPESPGDSAVTGNYTFQHADLGTIKGIGGILHSDGEFTGRLNRIEVRGTADVPDFSLDTANYPVPLYTRFSAIVDGTTGDTYLQPVQAKLGASEFSCSGAVVNVKGKGHTIDLDVDVPAGRIQDFLQLAVKTQPPVMTGVLAMKTKLHIRPGKESVTQKLGMQGTFGLNQMHFTNPDVAGQGGHAELASPGRSERRQARSRGRGLPHDGKIQNGRWTTHFGKFELRHARSDGSNARCLHVRREKVRLHRQGEDRRQVIPDGRFVVEELAVESRRSVLSQTWRRGRNPGQGDRDEHRAQIRSRY